MAHFDLNTDEFFIDSLFSFYYVHVCLAMTLSPCSMALLSGTGNTKGLIVNTFLAFTEALNLRVTPSFYTQSSISLHGNVCSTRKFSSHSQRKACQITCLHFFALTLFSLRNAEEETRKNCNKF